MTLVNLGGLEVEVTPIADLNPVQAMTASLIMSRYTAALERQDHVGAEDAASDLIAYCTEGISADTIRGLEPDQIEALFDVILPEPESDLP